MATTIKITASCELSENQGKMVETPNGTTFKVVSWLSNSKHGMSTAGANLGSRLEIKRDGKIEVYFNNPSGQAGAGKLTDFYNEVGLKTSGKGGGGGARKFEVKNLDCGTEEQLREVLAECERLLKEIEVQKELERNEALLRKLLAQDPSKVAELLAQVQ